jgi:hypothetical protein
MRSSVASRNRIGPAQHRPIGCGKGFEARPQSACYHTSAGSSACRRKTGQGTGLGERFHGAKSGSHSTLRRRKPDSNPQSRSEKSGCSEARHLDSRSLGQLERHQSRRVTRGSNPFPSSTEQDANSRRGLATRVTRCPENTTAAREGPTVRIPFAPARSPLRT